MHCRFGHLKNLKYISFRCVGTTGDVVVSDVSLNSIIENLSASKCEINRILLY